MNTVETLERGIRDLNRLRSRLLQEEDGVGVDPDALAFFTLAVSQLMSAEQYLTLALYNQRREAGQRR